MATVPRSLFLLGAGASFEAGVPIANGLTTEIVEAVTKGTGWGGERATTRALHAAVGAMIAHDTAAGGRVTAGVDVERLFSAIEMLSNRRALEVSPFVADWIPAVEGAGDELVRRDDFLSSRLREGLDPSAQHRNEYDARRAGGAAVDALMRELDRLAHTPNSEAVFERLRRELLEALPGCLRFRRGEANYLGGCFDPAIKATAIATLNYDLTVESAGAAAGVDIETGVERWANGFNWQWGHEGAVRLLKLHGSVGWHLVRGVPPGGRIQVDRVIAATPEGASYVGPGLVFGQRGKLRTDGPFLAMLIEFHRLLSEVDRLVVIGYSFRDAHVNHAIRGWLNSRARPNLIVINPDEEVIRNFIPRETAGVTVKRGVANPGEDAIPEIELWPLGTSHGLQTLSDRAARESEVECGHWD